jgi:carboxymethylenebutenolidase
MITAEPRIPIGGGSMRTYIARPDGEGPYPAVILYSNVRGLSDDLRWCARRYAAAGFVCAVPDVYHRIGDILLDADSPLEEVQKIKAACYAHAMTAYQTSGDAEALLDWLDADLGVAAGPKGVVGHCMGGYFAPLLAGLYPERIGAAAAINPVKLLEDRADQPRQYLDKVQGELYFGFAERDKNTPPEMIGAWCEVLAQTCSSPWSVDTYLGQKHGFAVPGRSAIWNPPAAETVFARTIALFGRALGVVTATTDGDSPVVRHEAAAA